ncbi:MAG TPA: leucyl aminopeptidase [Ktedonobacteraceae bacterium]|jgi:leucyl aminopeptidase|nr:leucyl aminopeptidase [Ktedonobacteraceae bacterium]
MDIRLLASNVQDIACDALVVSVAAQKEERQESAIALSKTATRVDHILGGLISEMYAAGEFKGALGELTTIHSMGKLAAKRVLLVGLGAKSKISPQGLRRASATAARHLQNTGAHSIVLALDWDESEQLVQAEIEGALTGLYTFRKYLRAKENSNGREVSQIQILTTDANDSKLKAALHRGMVFAEATNFARDLVNEPPNVLTPGELANRATAMARQFGLEYQVLDRPQMQELGMGGLLAVSQGSVEPPKFIILRYKGDPGNPKGMALAGKGITFDSGGISIKPAERMHEMKGDMAGAAAVIAAMQIIATLKPPINVTALVSTTENMPGGSAYRPGDIIRIMNGKTVEILNTDAEGRLVLADAISYAVKEGLSPIIDVATLTGAIVIALGTTMSGIFCNDSELCNEIIDAGRAVGEKFWPMPLDDDYEEEILSDIADVRQTGGRPASACKAAKILEQFVDDAQWAHLDIAGTDFIDVKKPYQERGATGFATRTLAELVLRRAEELMKG